MKNPIHTLRRTGLKGLLAGLLLAVAIPGMAIAATHPFDDVPEGQWYSDAVEWAYAEGITTGVGPNTFAGEDTVNRYQLFTVQHRLWENMIEPQLDDLRSDVNAIDVPSVYSAWVNHTGGAHDNGTTDGVSSERVGTGNYVVTFPRDVTDCSWTATHRSTDGNFIPLPDPDFHDEPVFDLSTWNTGVFPNAEAQPTQIRVRVADHLGDSKNTNFQLQVICTETVELTINPEIALP